jgi:hypothetical protein
MDVPDGFYLLKGIEKYGVILKSRRIEEYLKNLNSGLSMSLNKFSMRFSYIAISLLLILILI